MTIIEFGTTIIVGLCVLLMLAKLQDVTQAPPTRNPFSSTPDDAYL